jgi:hypothetical protein
MKKITGLEKGLYSTPHPGPNDGEQLKLLKALHNPEQLQDANNHLIIRLKGALKRGNVVPEAVLATIASA